MKIIITLCLFCFTGCGESPSASKKTITASPRLKTSSVQNDADDCAIWIHPTNPSLSVIIGNDKKEDGALYVWDLDGKEIFKTETLHRPVNLDVRYGVNFDGEIIDILACGIRSSNEIKVFKIDPYERKLLNITTKEGIPSGFDEDTYGLTLYKRSNDGALFAFVTKKSNDDIHQIELYDDNNGAIAGTLVNSFGGNDQKSFVEGMCADDETGILYCCDEDYGVLKYDINDGVLVNTFALKDGIRGDREGIALYTLESGKGYIIVSSQGNSTLKIYDREGDNAFIQTVKTLGSNKSDGIAATSRYLGPKFPNGAVVCHNDKDHNFVAYAWENIMGPPNMEATSP